MRPDSEASRLHLLSLAYALAMAVAVVAGVALLGWAGDLPALRAVVPGFIPMMPLTALGLVLLSVSLIALAGGQARGWRLVAGLAAALAVVAIGAVTLSEYVLGWDLGVDRLLFPRAVIEAWPVLPGRPPWVTSICLVLLGLGLTGLPRARTNRFITLSIEACALATSVVAYVMALGYLYDVSALYALMHSSPMAVPSAATLMALSVALIAGTPGAPLADLLSARGAAGRTMRLLAAPTLLGPIALGWLRLSAEHAGLIPRLVGLEIMVLALALGGFGFLWWSTSRFVQAEAELLDLYEKAPCGYHSLDLEGRVVRINDTELAWTGYTREEVLGKPWASIFLAERARASYQATFSTFVARGWLKDVQIELRRRDGSILPVMGTATVVHDEAGGYLMSRCTLYDMTDRRQLEEARERSEAHVRAVLEAAPDALLLVDADGRVSYSNTYASELYGYPAGELTGLSIERLVPEADREAHRAAREAAYRSPGARTMALGHELRGVKRDGSEFPAEVRLSPVLAPDGPFVAVSVRDLTERQRLAQEAARQAIEAEQAHELARVKDYLLSTISHEMKTPVSLIVGYAEMLEDKYPDEEAVTGLLEGGHRLATHISRIVDLGALLSGAMPLYRAEVDPLELLEAAHQLVAAGLASARVQWIGEVAPDLPRFEGDTHRLAQMLAELVDNARRFTPPGGTVGMRVGSKAGRIVITVKDTGPGIEPRQLSQVWEAFNQRQTSDALRPGGLGLGLALVKGIVALHGGHVTLTCPSDGGTLVTIELPALAGETPGPTPDTHFREYAASHQVNDTTEGGRDDDLEAEMNKHKLL